MRQKRVLSQIFLRDESIVGKIIDSLDIDNKTVVEIGPGDGALTCQIARRAKELYCIEIDKQLSQKLEVKFLSNPNVSIITADILSLSLERFSENFILVGNLPYHISKDFIHYIVQNRKIINEGYFTFQKEFVEKLIAKPSTPYYCPLSCLIQYYAKVRKIFDIPATSFSPVPKVDSAFINISFYESPPDKALNEKLLFEIIEKAFFQKRKKINNSLRIFIDDLNFFSSLGINPNLRPQDLSIKEYILLSNRLHSQSIS
tara:strand:- start:2636 stop:3412 length:777 start_codon:yes stop_codon:yes gene_type:complete